MVAAVGWKVSASNFDASNYFDFIPFSSQFRGTFCFDILFCLSFGALFRSFGVFYFLFVALVSFFFALRIRDEDEEPRRQGAPSWGDFRSRHIPVVLFITAALNFSLFWFISLKW